MLKDNQIYKPVKAEKPSDLIVKEIRKLIEKGELRVGDKLPPEDELVKRYQVSKVTLREALQTLVAYGQIEKKRGAKGGSIITNSNSSTGIELLYDYLKAKRYSIIELNEARRLIEPLLVELVAKRITKREIEELKKSIKNHEEHIKKNLSTEGGWRFYLLLAKISKNKILASIEELLLRLLIDVEHSLNMSILTSGNEEHRKYNLAALEGQKRIAELIMSNKSKEAKQEMIAYRKKMHRLLLDIEKHKSQKNRT